MKHRYLLDAALPGVTPLTIRKFGTRRAHMFVPARLMAFFLLMVSWPSLGIMPNARPAIARGRFPSRSQPARTYGRVSTGFEVNRGQVDGRIKFLARAPGYTLALMNGGVVVESDRVGRVGGGGMAWSRLRAGGGTAPTLLRFDGADPHPRVVGLRRLPGTVNYFVGDDPRDWRTDIPTYARVEYRNLYPGISLAFSGAGGSIESEWLLAAHARPDRVSMTIAGGGLLRVDARGELVIPESRGRFRIAAPIAFQMTGGKRRSVVVRYGLLGPRRFGLHLGAYDSRAPLVVDPVLRYATYLGGSSPDYTSGIAVDRHNSAYVVGSTLSPDFPAVHAFQPTKPSTSDQLTASVTKFNAAGTALLYSTYLGGAREESGTAIAVDAAGAAFVTGFTDSADFPQKRPLRAQTHGCNRDPAHAGDAFVTELSPTGDRLVYSTCLGGSGTDWGTALALGAGGAIYVTGGTNSVDFPIKRAMQSHRSAGVDAFVAMIGWGGGPLEYSTYLGGTGDDQTSGIAVDRAGAAYVVGATNSRDFPLHSPIRATFGGGDWDAFVAKLGPRGRTLRYSTYLGGSGDDQASGVAVDGSGQAYVTGVTVSADFPTVNALQPRYGGAGDAFVTALNPSGTRLLYSTYLGGSSSDAATGIALDTRGDMFLTGSTRSPDFPTRGPIQPAYGGGFYYGDAFAGEIHAGGASIAYSTYLGGASDDVGMGVAVDRQGSAYVTGGTSSLNFPIVGGLKGGRPARGDAFVVKIAQG